MDHQSLRATQDRIHRTQYRARWFISLLFVLIVAIAAGTSTMLLHTAEQANFTALQQDFATAAQSRLSAVAVWDGGQDSLISAFVQTDMVRLFAVQAETARLAGVDATSIDADQLGSRARQLRFMESQLDSFVTRNEFLNARMVNRNNEALVSTSDHSLADAETLRATIPQVLESGDPLALPARNLPNEGVAITWLYPIHPPRYMQEYQGKPVAVLVVERDISDVIRALEQNPGRYEERLLQISPATPAVQDGSKAQPLRIEEFAIHANRVGLRALPGWHDTVFAGEVAELPFALRSLPDGSEVYAAAWPAPNFPWMAEVEIDKDEALQNYASYRRMVLLVAVACVLMAGLFLGMLWWWLLGRGERTVARQVGMLSETVSRQKQLLDSINGSLAEGIVLRSADGRLQYANAAFADMVGQPLDSLLGKTIYEIHGGNAVNTLGQRLNEVLETGRISLFSETLGQGDMERIYQITSSPLSAPNGERSGVVSVFRDVTEFSRAQEYAQRVVNQTIGALVRAVEGVDPYLCGQSSRTSLLASELASFVGLDEKHINTLRTGALLSQIGMIQLPRTLLSKEGALTEEERSQLERHVDIARAVLADLDFGLPVLPAITQMHELMDGSGYPARITGDEICLDARILGACNAFCALVRPRSFRQARSVNAALEILSTPGKYDPAVVQALRGFLQTPQGRDLLCELVGCDINELADESAPDSEASRAETEPASEAPQADAEPDSGPHPSDADEPTV